MIKKDESGIAGFFVDIPAILAILIGLSIFTVSMYRGYSTYLEEEGEEQGMKDLDHFMDSFRSYHVIAESPGVFSASKLSDLNMSILMETYHPQTLDYQYNITIQDHGGYAADYSCSFQTVTPPAQSDIYSTRTSLIIADGMGRNHLAELQISIWGV